MKWEDLESTIEIKEFSRLIRCEFTSEDKFKKVLLLYARFTKTKEKSSVPDFGFKVEDVENNRSFFYHGSDAFPQAAAMYEKIG